MVIFVARYAFIFWFLTINSNKGEHVLRSQMDFDDSKMYQLSACTVKCVQQRVHSSQENSPLKTCFDFCRSENPSSLMPAENLKKIQENYNMKLICRDDRSLTFRIDIEGTTNFAESSIDNEDATLQRNDTANNFIEPIYFLKIIAADYVDLYLSDEKFFTINNLSNNTIHTINAVAVHGNNEYSVITKDQKFETLQRGFIPGVISDIQVKEFNIDKDSNKLLIAKIVWKPAADMTCRYSVISFSPESVDYEMMPIEIRSPRQLYTYYLENLTFSSLYKVGIRAKNPNNDLKESALLWKEFKAPACVEWHKYNFNICAPFEPEGLEVDKIFVKENIYSLSIRWKLPKYLPNYYNLKIIDYDVNGDTHEMNVSKELNNIFIREIVLFSMICKVYLTAYTPGGNSTAFVSHMSEKNVLIIPDKNHHIIKLISVIVAPIFCIAMLSLTTFIICHRRAKLKRYQQRCKYFEELEKKAPIDPKASFDFSIKSLSLLTAPEDVTQLQLDLEDKIFFNDGMEINRNDIMLHEVLGEGAFGLVRRAIYHDNKLGAREVAVKMLKDHPSLDDVRAFRREIEVMKSVEKHPNIVGIIGHCTKQYNEIMLLTEYCSLGNLLDFLRNEWKYLYELSNKCNYTITLPNRIKVSQKHHSTLHSTKRNCNYNSSSSSSNKNNNKTNNNNSNAFNIDATIIEKLRLRYKSLNTSQCNESTLSDMQDISIALQNKDKVATTPTSIKTTTSAGAISSATDNKSYGYDEICTNACKCHVDVVTIKVIDKFNNAMNTMETDQQYMQQLSPQQQGQYPEKHQQHTPKTISIKNCECKHRLPRTNIKIKEEEAETATVESFTSVAVENRAYFKCLPDSGATLTQLKGNTQHEKQKLSHTSHNNFLACSVKKEPLTASDMLDIAKQVAVGMEFLAKNKVVHRDLAARNVLVSPDRTIKIADFGLSRDIYQDNIYKKTGNGKLPIKWLALESMTHQVYTTQSDVWSFGILLYEIVTLGGTPYPSIPTNRLLHLLKTGYRMEKPKNCEQEFYNLMYSCWNVNPAERPTFNEIIKILDNLLLDSTLKPIENIVIAAATNTENVNYTSNDVDVSYLKPLK